MGIVSGLFRETPTFAGDIQDRPWYKAIPDFRKYEVLRVMQDVRSPL